MKKIVVSAFSLFLLGAVSASAQTTTGGQSGTETQTSTPSATQGTAPVGTQAGTQSGTQTSTGTTTQTEATSPGTTATGNAAAGTTTTSTDAAAGTTVALEELPEPVKATLASEKLKTWTPSAAQLMKDADGKEYFSIQLKQANQIGTVKLSKDGKPVK